MLERRSNSFHKHHSIVSEDNEKFCAESGKSTLVTIIMKPQNGEDVMLLSDECNNEKPSNGIHPNNTFVFSRSRKTLKFLSHHILYTYSLLMQTSSTRFDVHINIYIISLKKIIHSLDLSLITLYLSFSCILKR